jgi:catechol 2,3-dioxygenase-like lactoylglutathione lyase family enzyme
MRQSVPGRGALLAALAASLLIAGGAARAGAAGTAAEAGRVLGLDHLTRMVSDLDASVRFYEALGFRRDAGIASAWRVDPALDRLYGIRHARVREARLLLQASASGQPFALVLREFAGLPRRNMSAHTPWEPGASHFGLVVPDAAATWGQLRAAGLLRARSWGGALVALPGETRGALAYLTDPDGLDIEIIDQRPAVPASDAGPGHRAFVPGIDHLGLIILDADKARAFYGGLLGGALLTQVAPWMHGDFTDAVVGGHGNVLRFYNEAFALANAPAARMNLELVEFQNRKKPVETYGIADIGVGCVALEVTGLDALLARARAGGARLISRRGIVRRSDGRRAVLLRDPDVGGFVELIEAPRA